MAEIDAAVRAVRETGNDRLVVLGCTAAYPAPASSSNLRSLPVLRDALDVPVGLSDHTLGIGAAIAAVAFGAVLLEKHLTLDREDGGVDSAFSLEPDDLRLLVSESRTAWEALGSATVGPRIVEKEGLRFRRSLFVTRDVVAGEPVTAENVRSVRPADGLRPDAFGEVEGRAFRADAAKGTPLSWDLV
jgi:N-acetylneuraminate synthase